MPLEDSLEHFVSCLTHEEQLKHWANIRFFSEEGRTCFMVNHKEAISSMQRYIMRLKSENDRQD